MEAVKISTDTLFILLGAIMVLAMHSGFAFLEVGTVRKKNQVNALVKILTDFAVSTIVYFFVGYGVAYGVSFMVGAEQLAEKSGFEVTKFFFPADLCRSGAGDYFRRYRRAREIQSATGGDRADRGPDLSVLRRHCVE